MTKHFPEKASTDGLVGQALRLPPPAVSLHCSRGGHKPLADSFEVGVAEVEAEDEEAAEEEVSSNLEWEVNIPGTVSFNHESGDFNRIDINTPNDIEEYLIVEYQVEEV